MKKYILISGLAILGLSVSCTGDKNSSEETTTPESGVETAISPSEPVAGGDQQTMSAEGQPMNISSDPAVTAAAPAAGTGGPTMPNPAHGQPGHRCEVAVGAPIPADGSAPAQSAAPQNIQMQTGGQPQQITASPAPTAAPATSIMNAPAPTASPAAATAPGMNPPHGEPGHDCAIPVGSPLKK